MTRFEVSTCRHEISCKYLETRHVSPRCSPTRPILNSVLRISHMKAPCPLSDETDDHAENFNLYLSTPNCAAIFVAACLDNGFARMLEPYTGHEAAYEKIILVSPGHMALEMFKLDFKSVSWPSVFAPPDIRPEVLQRHRQEVSKRKAAATQVTKDEDSKPLVANQQAGQAVLRSLPPPLADWKGPVHNLIAAFTAGRGLSAAGKAEPSSEWIRDGPGELKAAVD